MATTIARVAYHSTVREMPSDERPRERLEHYGAASLQTAELLAIILRVGTAQENVIELSSRLLRQYGGVGGLVAGGVPGVGGGRGRRAGHGGRAYARTCGCAARPVVAPP